MVFRLYFFQIYDFTERSTMYKINIIDSNLSMCQIKKMSMMEAIKMDG